MEQVALSGGQSGSECVEYSRLIVFVNKMKLNNVIIFRT